MRSTVGTARFLGLLPVLGLGTDDGSEHTVLGRGRRDTDLGGGGARVMSFSAASLTVSMTDDSRVATEVSGLAVRGGAGAMSACPGAVGEATLEATWSNELAHETASSVVA